MEPQENRLSRRTMIKRIGAATAVAWTAPVLSSLRTPAFADYGVCRDPQGVGCAVGGDPCFGQQACGAGCTCLNTPNELCICHVCILCSAVTPCKNTAECPPGWACSASCCPGLNRDPNLFFCHPQCGTKNPAPCLGAAAGTATSMGVV